MPTPAGPLFAHEFETRRPSNPIYCHQDFLEKLEAYRTMAIAKRVSLLMQRLAVDSRRQHYKTTHGANQGWRRSRLGGSGGSHYYAWWAPRTAAPLRAGEGFLDAPEGAVFLRDIRHHDDHSTAYPQSFHEHYLPVSVREIRNEEYGPAPWTPQQVRFATARHPVRILKGHPGSGKTTALLHAADASGAERVLYLTYSRDLAALAQDYFDRYCSAGRQFTVLTFEAFLRRITQVDAQPSSYSDLRRLFRGDVVPLARHLGPWTERTVALYDELHAHLVGSSLPLAAGRFAQSAGPRASDKDFRTRRIRYIGEGAANCALDIATRLERNVGSLAGRYFPELDLAWKAASRLTSGDQSIAAEWAEFDCIAVDECQDLTPIETFATIELAGWIGRKRRQPVAVFFAGDEAQTVRPTDFEWGWMNDLLHSRLGTPTEFKLSSNLRSPRSIAMLVNHVWGLYSEIEKRDRPSGTGTGDIDDDATDEVLFCTGAPGEELDRLLTTLASREGLAMVAYDEKIASAMPAPVRSSILTAAEVKGLDFHTVCLINAGQHLEKIIGAESEYRTRGWDIESIRRRLAIDELRVGISRPSDRLIWLDISPTTRTVRGATAFLGGLDHHVAPCVPSALLTTLEEEQLDLEERVQRCQLDARQFLSVRADIAWSRAQQAVTLLGDETNPNAITDRAVRDSARETLAEICFCLGFRKAQLAPELGRRDLFAEAAAAAPRAGLTSLIRDVGVSMSADPVTRLPALGALAENIGRQKGEIEGWFRMEIASKVPAWIDELESAMTAGDNAIALARVMPPLYEALALPDAAERSARLLDRCVRSLLKGHRHEAALSILRRLPERRPELEADCLVATGRHAEAAALYRSIGKVKEAVNCYRAIPDFEAAVALIRDVPDHPAAGAYEWLTELRGVLAKRPDNFTKVMTAPEKKVLEQLLEQALGATRKKAAAKKVATKTVATKKAAAKKIARPRRPSFF